MLLGLCGWFFVAVPFSALLGLFLLLMMMICCCFLFLLSCAMFSSVMFLPSFGGLIAVAMLLFCASRFVCLVPFWSAFFLR